MATFPRTALSLTLFFLTLHGTSIAQQIEVVSQPKMMVFSSSDDGEMVFESDGPTMMIGGMDGGGLGDLIGGAASSGGVYNFPIGAQELERFARILRFSSEQSVAGTTLLDGYTAAFKTKSDDARKKVTAIREEAKENEDQDGWKKTLPITKDLQAERDKAESAFLTDFKSIATAEQMKRWEKVEMYRRRVKAMRTGGFSMGPTGARVDLFAIIDALKLPEENQTKLEPIMDAYERDVDARLTERAAAQARQREAMKDAAKSHDFSIISKFDAERYDAGIKMRDTHRSYAAQITSALPKDWAAKFDLAFHKTSYPRIYRERYAAKAIAAAVAFDDLNTDQRKDLAALKERYDSETNSLCRRAETAALAAEQAAHDKHMTETVQGGEEGAMMIKRTFATDGDPAADQQRSERRELEDATVKSLLAILSTGQAERLPARPGAVVGEDTLRTPAHTKTR